MKPVNRIDGSMVPIVRSDIDTDQIIPQQFLKLVERTGYGEFLFYNWAHNDDGSPRPDFILNHPERKGAKVLVAGRNFGCGSSRVHAVWAIQDWGFEAVVAPSFADIFRNNAAHVGLLTVELPEDVVNTLAGVAEDPYAHVNIDLARQSIDTEGISAEFPVESTVKERLLRGIDPIGATLEFESELSSYESQRATWLPRADLSP